MSKHGLESGSPGREGREPRPGSRKEETLGDEKVNFRPVDIRWENIPLEKREEITEEVTDALISQAPLLLEQDEVLEQIAGAISVEEEEEQSPQTDVSSDYEPDMSAADIQRLAFKPLFEAAMLVGAVMSTIGVVAGLVLRSIIVTGIFFFAMCFLMYSYREGL